MPFQFGRNRNPADKKSACNGRTALFHSAGNVMPVSRPAMSAFGVIADIGILCRRGS